MDSAEQPALADASADPLSRAAAASARARYEQRLAGGGPATDRAIYGSPEVKYKRKNENHGGGVASATDSDDAASAAGAVFGKRRHRVTTALLSWRGREPHRADADR